VQKKTIDWLNISIRDHGVGITNFDNIFVPFYTTKTQGSGIGLALCRQIMFNHNGLIKIHNYQDDHPINHKKNEGVEVVLSLPVDTEVVFSI
jgi:signal transduction histidine kinase